MNDDVPASVAAYLDALTDDQQSQILPVFNTVLDAIPTGYTLGIHYGMPGWVVPLERFPNTYNKQPLPYVSLAAGKSYNSLYLMATHADPDRDAAFRAKWAERGLRLDMGKSCLRYRKVDNLDLELIADEIAAVTPDRLVELHQAARA